MPVPQGQKVRIRREQRGPGGNGKMKVSGIVGGEIFRERELQQPRDPLSVRIAGFQRQLPEQKQRRGGLARAQPPAALRRFQDVDVFVPPERREDSSLRYHEAETEQSTTAVSPFIAFSLPK